MHAEKKQHLSKAPANIPFGHHHKEVLRSEILSGICAQLRTVAASNNRVHMP